MTPVNAAKMTVPAQVGGLRFGIGRGAIGIFANQSVRKRQAPIYFKMAISRAVAGKWPNQTIVGIARFCQVEKSARLARSRLEWSTTERITIKTMAPVMRRAHASGISAAVTAINFAGRHET
jgi:hypothetical protein